MKNLLSSLAVMTVTFSGLAELVLKHEAGNDTTFHLIAVERTQRELNCIRFSQKPDTLDAQ